MKRVVLPVLLIAFSSTLAKPDVFHFKNGDRLTGELERIQGNDVIMKTETIGEVRISKDKLQEFSSSASTVVLVKSGQRVEGTLSLLPSGDWQVQTSSGAQKVEAKNVEIIYPAKTYAEKGYGNKPKLWNNWAGKGALGYSQVRGDQTSRTLSLDFNATRRMPRLLDLPETSSTNFYLNMLFAKSTDFQGNHISTDNVSSGVRQDFKFTEKNFWFLLGQLDHFSTQSLDLRQTYGGGVGRDLIHRPSMELQALGGITYVDEKFQGGVRNQNADALVGETFNWKLTHWVTLNHTLSFYPTLTDGGEYRFDTITGLTTQLTKRVSLTSSFTDHFLSNPLPGHRKNELILTTGIGMSF